jgi:hypothetical protein
MDEKGHGHGHGHVVKLEAGTRLELPDGRVATTQSVQVDDIPQEKSGNGGVTVNIVIIGQL